MPTGDLPTPDGSPNRSSSAGQVLLRLRLFFSSYMPLFLILCIRFEGTPLRIACAALAGLGLEEAWRITHLAVKTKTSYPYRVDAIDDAGGLVSGFMASYLLPFLVSTQPTGLDIAAYGVFFGVACLVAVNSDLALVNPTIYLLRRQVVRISSTGRSLLLISRRTPKVGDEIMAVRLGGGIVEKESGSKT